MLSIYNEKNIRRKAFTDIKNHLQKEDVKAYISKNKDKQKRLTFLLKRFSKLN